MNRAFAGCMQGDTMKISVEVTGAQAQHLTEAAARFNVLPPELATAGIRDLVALPDTEFKRAPRVLEENREVYARLR